MHSPGIKEKKEKKKGGGVKKRGGKKGRSPRIPFKGRNNKYPKPQGREKGGTGGRKEEIRGGAEF